SLDDPNATAPQEKPLRPKSSLVIGPSPFPRSARPCISHGQRCIGIYRLGRTPPSDRPTCRKENWEGIAAAWDESLQAPGHESVRGQNGQDELATLHHPEQEAMGGGIPSAGVVLTLCLHDLPHPGGIQRQRTLGLAAHAEYGAGPAIINGEIHDGLRLDRVALGGSCANMHQKLFVLPRIPDR